MAEVLSSPVFGIGISIAAYAVGVWINKKLKTPLANPMLIATILLIVFFLTTGIPMEYYKMCIRDRTYDRARVKQADRRDIGIY